MNYLENLFCKYEYYFFVEILYELIVFFVGFFCCIGGYWILNFYLYYVGFYDVFVVLL